MLRRAFVQQPERVRQALGVQDLQLAVVVDPGEVTGLLPTPIENEHRTVARERGGECRRRGVRHVMRHVAELGRIEAGQRFGQELARRRGVRVAKVVPRIVQAQLARRPVQSRVERIGHHVDVVRLQASVAQAPRGGQVRVSHAEKGTGRFPCLRRLNRSSSAAARQRPIDHDGRRRVVVQRIDAQDLHGGAFEYAPGAGNGRGSRPI